MSFSFLHIADIHLGRSFSDLSKLCFNKEVEEIFAVAVVKSFNNFIDFAILKSVDFVLISGDTFDSTEQDFESKLILKSGLKKLEKAGIKTILVCGNHDPLSSYNTKTFDFDEFSNIKIVGLNTSNPFKVCIKDKDEMPYVVVQALSYNEAEFKENPINYFSMPSMEESKLFNIGLVHSDIGGNSNCTYAPCLKSDLESLNYNYWALGHIHKPDLNSTNIQYCGTIQGRNIKETGVHGLKYIRVDDYGNIVENSLVPLDVVRFESVNVNLTELNDVTEVVFSIKEQIDNTIFKCGDYKPELFIFNVNLIGNVGFYNEINEEFFNVISEHIKNEYSNKVLISKFKSEILPKINIEDIKKDIGIIGEIYKTVENQDNFENLFISIDEKLNKIIYDCKFTNDEYLKFKEEVIKESYLSCLNLCSRLYSSERTEN